MTSPRLEGYLTVESFGDLPYGPAMDDDEAAFMNEAVVGRGS
jgi:hypothetical protein